MRRLKKIGLLVGGRVHQHGFARPLEAPGRPDGGAALAADQHRAAELAAPRLPPHVEAYPDAGAPLPTSPRGSIRGHSRICAPLPSCGRGLPGRRLHDLSRSDSPVRRQERNLCRLAALSRSVSDNGIALPSVCVVVDLCEIVRVCTQGATCGMAWNGAGQCGTQTDVWAVQCCGQR